MREPSSQRLDVLDATAPFLAALAVIHPTNARPRLATDLSRMVATGVSICSMSLRDSGLTDGDLRRFDVALLVDDGVCRHDYSPDQIVHATRLLDHLEIPYTSTSKAGVTALEELGARSIALASPFSSHRLQARAEALASTGHPVVSSHGLGIACAEHVSDVTAEQVRGLCLKADAPEASAVVIDGSGLATGTLIAQLERELQKPVVSVSQASLWHCLEIMGVAGALPGFGRLLEGYESLRS